MLKQLASHLPNTLQQQLKKLQSSRQIGNGTFRSDEPEFAMLKKWVKPGDWCLDLGANIGHYTNALSDLVGPEGRVLAFEPVPHTFEILSSNTSRFKHRNVSLINAAASNCCTIVSMGVPKFDSGLDNYYRAAIGYGDIQAVAVSVDSLVLNHRIALVKMDVEGHEWTAFCGMFRTVSESRPVLIIEGDDPAILAWLIDLNYSMLRLPDSPNRIYTPN